MIALINLAFISCCGNEKFPDYFQDVQYLMEEKEYKSVVKIFENIEIKNSLKKDWYYYNYAIALYKSYPERVRYSFIFLTKAEKYNMNDQAILYHLGVCYYKMGMYERAIERFIECKKYQKKDYLYFNENLDADFWIAYLSNCIGDYEKSSEVLTNSSSENSALSYLKTIRNEEGKIEELLTDEKIDPEIKVYCIDYFFNHENKYSNIERYKNLCIKLIPLADKETVDFLKINLIYFYMALDDIKSAKVLLNGYYDHSFLLLDNNIDLIQESFAMVCSFYFLKKNDISKACVFRDQHEMIHTRPLNMKYQAKNYNQKYVYDYFSSNRDFQYLKF